MTVRTRRPSSAVVVAAVAALVIVGCSEPELTDGPVEETGADRTPPPDEDPDDEARDELTGAIATLQASVATAEDHLRAAGDTTDLGTVRREVDRALGRLLEGAGTGAGDDPPVLPATSPERGEIGERDDLLSSTLTVARDVGGSAGTAVTDLLRDQVAGDLGAWERDAEGMVASLARSASASSDLEQLTSVILELPGEATRALTWAMVAAEANDLDTATTAAARGASHLELAGLAIDEVRRTLPRTGTSQDAEGDG